MKKLRFHPGETIVVNFLIPFDANDVQSVVLSFRDKNHVVLECPTTSFTTTTKTVETEENGVNVQIQKNYLRFGFSLNQAETLLFDEFGNYKMQLNVFGPNGSRITSNEADVITYAQHLTKAGWGSSAVEYNAAYETELDYNKLENLPSINNKVLKGNRTLPETTISNSQIDNAVNN